jgi:hypothetical protein
MGFLDNYEASRERLERWLKTYPTGRIETRIVEFSAEKGYVLVEAKAFKGKAHNDDCSICKDVIEQPAGIDYAYGYQGAYQQNMKRWFVEDTVTSAIMRVQQLVMGGAERSTKEIMEQVEKTSAKVANTDKEYDYWTTKFGEVPSYKTEEDMESAGVPTLASGVAEIAKQLGGELVPEAPQCRHGHRIFRSGNSAKTKKDWANYSCVGRKPDQCDPIWLVLTSDGTWKPQV